MASRTARSQCFQGRPLRAGCGKSGSRSAHCGSVGEPQPLLPSHPGVPPPRFCRPHPRHLLIGKGLSIYDNTFDATGDLWTGVLRS